MAFTQTNVAALCRRNADYLRENLKLIESGHLKCHIFDLDVTEDEAARMRANLSRLEQIISQSSSRGPRELILRVRTPRQG